MEKKRFAGFLTLIFALICIAVPLSISATEISLGLLALSLPFILKGRGTDNGPRGLFPILLFTLFLLVPFLSLINSPDISVSLPWIRRHFFILVIPLVMLTVAPVARYWKRFLALFLAASTLAAAYAVLQVFFGENLSKPFLPKGYYVFSTAFFSQSNTLAEVLTLGFLAAIFAIRAFAPRWPRWLATGSAFLIFAGIICTRARTPLAVSALAGGWLTVRFFGKKGSAVILLALVAILAANQLDNRLFWRFRQISPHHTGGDRMEIWHYSVVAFRSHPVIGIGFGNFRQFLQSHTDEKHRFLTRYNHSHCNFLEAAATTGIVGLIIFLLFWGRVGWDMFSEWRKARDPLAQAVFLALFTAFLAFHAEGLTECNLKDAEAALPFFVLLGIFYSFRKYSRAMSRGKRNPCRFPRGN